MSSTRLLIDLIRIKVCVRVCVCIYVYVYVYVYIIYIINIRYIIMYVYILVLHHLMFMVLCIFLFHETSDCCFTACSLYPLFQILFYFLRFSSVLLEDSVLVLASEFKWHNTNDLFKRIQFTYL